MGDYLSQDKLHALARQHLGYFSGATVPQFYLKELELHLQLYPYDTKFRVTLTPKTGYGILTCLEQGCGGQALRLAPKDNSPGICKQQGFGSLSVYRAHIDSHPTHSKVRHQRVKAEQSNKSYSNHNGTLASSSVMIKREPAQLDLLSRLDATFGSSPKPGYSGGNMRPGIKSEPTDRLVPQKRLSDVAFPAGDAIRSNPLTRTPPKRTKIEAPKTPLSQVDRNSFTYKHTAAPGPSIERTRELIREFQDSISASQALLDRLRRKPKHSKSDVSRINRLSRQIQEFRKKKETLNATIPSVSPLKRTGSDVKPFATPSEQHSTASGSNIQLPPAFNNPFLDQKSIVGRLPQVNSVPSSSNARLSNATMDVGGKQPLDIMRRIDVAIPSVAGLPGPSDGLDENSDFHGRGRDLFAGPQAKADDIDKFLVAAGNAEQFDGNETVDKALEKLGLATQYQLLPGMEVALMAHQIIGVAWMLDKEKNKAYMGGCLSDEMGLGKTVQMIAVMVMNASDDPRCKTTLILAPTALLDQWKLEIEMKTNNGLKCLIYHGPSKPRKKTEILKYDVVLTTYQTMANEWPDIEAEEKAKKKKKKKPALNGFIMTDSDDEVKPKKKKKEAGLLFQIDFYRVVLDEAQNIRNRRTRNSRAVSSLRAQYRWCLTGTPIINGLADVYALFRFLKVRPWYDWSEFNSHITLIEKRNPTLAVARLQAILATCNLRRMKDTMLDGKKLIDLPPKEVTLVKLEFTPEELEIYKMVETKSQETFNRFRRAGTVLKNYTQVLVLLLRLRQICGHPSLIQEDGVSYIAPDELDDEYRRPEAREELARAKQLVSYEFVVKVKETLKQKALLRIAAEKQSVDATVEDEECPVCFDAFVDAVLTPCGHTFCRDCLINVLHTAQPEQQANDEDIRYRADERPCPSCRSPISADKLFSRQAFEPTDSELEEKTHATKADDSDEDMPTVSEIFKTSSKGKGRGKAKKTKKRPARRARVLDSDDIVPGDDEEEEDDDDDDEDMSDFIVQSDEDEEEKNERLKIKKRLGKRRAIIVDSDDEVDPEESDVIYGAKKYVPEDPAQIKLMPRFLPSTKMKHMMETLRTWAETHPDEKTLIVSQWTQCLQLVSDYLTENGVLHVKYQGNMDRKKRDQAVRVFMAKDKAQVMLMSLKCGGVGLNLTRANRVISLDLGWSQAIESQAFDRVHRLGQQKNVYVQRLVISNTVEDRVLALQERKQNLADGSLGEGKGKKIGRLSVRELATLFGLDHRGRALTNG